MVSTRRGGSLFSCGEEASLEDGGSAVGQVHSTACVELLEKVR